MTFVRHLYRIGLAGILFFGIPAGLSAQNDEIIEVEDSIMEVVDSLFTMNIDYYFREIPDNLLPTLSLNNRLDMLDFMESNMKAEVTNRLGGKSEMTLLTDSMLSIRVSKALQVDMYLINTAAPGDSDDEVICMIETFGSDSLSLESKVQFFNLSWELVKDPPQLSESFKNILSTKKVQTILKRDDEILKKN